MTAAILCAGERLEGDQVESLVARCAASLLRDGVSEGDAIGFMLRNDSRFLIALQAARIIGAYAVPINWHYQAQEASYIIADAPVKFLFIHEDLLSILDGVVPDTTLVVSLHPSEALAEAWGLSNVKFENLPTNRAQNWDEWLLDKAEPVLQGRPRSSMNYTSGTTGQPKGVRREAMTPEHVEKVLQVNRSVFGITSGAKVLVATPLYHSAPNVYALTALNLGELVVIEPRFDSKRMLSLIKKELITHLYIVPTLMHRLLALPQDERNKSDTSSLRFVLHGAAPCPPEIKRAIIAWWGPIINEFYGGSEAGPIAYIGSDDWMRKPGSVGRLAPYARVLITDDTGAALPVGSTGNIYVEQKAYPRFTYNGRPDLRAACTHPNDDGLFTLGDVGHIDSDGFLFLSDRKKDMVISGGVNIYPAEIEAELSGMPGIQDCAVFGIPDPEFGEMLMGIVQTVEGHELDSDTVRSWLRKRIAGYKVPRRIDFVKNLPREESGKIFKRKLRDPYWENVGRSI